MTAKKQWNELSERTRAQRFSVIAANHLPVAKPVVTMAAKHARCANKSRCTGPGCRASK